MSKYIGRVVDLGAAKESSRGSGASPSFWIPKVEFSFDDKVVIARSEASVGKLADTDNSFVTTNYGQGDLESEIRSNSFGLFLLAMMGSVSTAGPSDSAYTHTYTISESAQHQSLAFLVQDPNTSEMYKLIMLDSLEINMELDQIVRFTATFMGKKGNEYTTQTVTYAADARFTKKHLGFKVAANLASLDAASTISLKRLRFTTNKNAELDDVLGTAEPEDINNRQFSVEGEIELNYNDETFKDYFRNGTKRAVEIKLTNTDTLIGATSRPTLTFRMPKVGFFDWEPDYANNEIVKQTMSFKAEEDIDNSNAIISTCELINSQASY